MCASSSSEPPPAAARTGDDTIASAVDPGGRGLRLDDRVVEDAARAGVDMHELVRRLFPLPRSITGAGLRATLQQLAQVVPLAVTEVPTGTPVFDWTIPEEWSIDEAYLEHESGKRFAEWKSNNLHVVAYSTPMDRVLTLDELRPHLHSLPDKPDWIPYRTSFYERNWGFCLADRVRRGLPSGRYRVVIRARLAAGALSIGEFKHRGANDDEILVFAHTCHPSLANDNLSGIAVATHLAARIARSTTRYSYRFVFAPSTIGSIAWLATHRAELGRIRHGLVLSLLGDAGPLHYKKSRAGTSNIDRIAAHVLHTQFPRARLREFEPWGYDERQFGSPGINLPVGRLTRTPNGEFPEYHTSADDVDFVSAESLGQAWLACLRIFEALEADRRYVNLQPFGEPQLGRRGLYQTGAGGAYVRLPEQQFALFWVLNQSDGTRSLLDIAERSGLSMHVLACAADDLVRAGLLKTGD